MDGFPKPLSPDACPWRAVPKETRTATAPFPGQPPPESESLIPLHVASRLWAPICDSCVPMILDQTTIRGIQTLLIGAVFEGRVLPVAFSCFMYRTNPKEPEHPGACPHRGGHELFPRREPSASHYGPGLCACHAVGIHLRAKASRFLCQSQKERRGLLPRPANRPLSRFPSVKPGQIQSLFRLLPFASQRTSSTLSSFRAKGFQETLVIVESPRDSLVCRRRSWIFMPGACPLNKGFETGRPI